MRKDVEKGIGKQSQNLVQEESGGLHDEGEGRPTAEASSPPREQPS